MPKVALSRLVRPIVLTAVLLATGLIAARSPAPAVQASAPAQPRAQSQVVGAGPNRAALAVDYGGGRVDKVCLAFTEQDITGYELLTRAQPSAGLSREGAVCTIGGTGCAIEDCFCQCDDLANCSYWAYYLWQNDQWEYSNWGIMAMADTTVVAHGDMQAWVWGSGNQDEPPSPPNVTYEDICPAINAQVTPTPTLTATLTPETGNPQVGTRPQVTFTASPQTVSQGQCTVLSWQTVDAASVTLNGTPVDVSGSQQECPQASRTWTLTATNAAGPTTQTVAVQVAVARTSTPTVQVTSTATTRPAVTTGTAQPTPAQNAIVARTPGVLPTTANQAGLISTPAGGFMPVTPEALADLGVPLASTAELLQPLATPEPVSTPTRYVFSLPPTETPRPRRELAADRPTPTPLLIARAAGGSGAAPAPGAGSSGAPVARGSGLLAESRAFTPELLPQYAAYAATVVILLVIGWLVLRRRNGLMLVTVAREHADDAQPAARAVRKE